MQQSGKFISSRPVNGPIFSKRPFQAKGYSPDHLIAGFMSERVIRLFQTIQIKRQEGHSPARFPGQVIHLILICPAVQKTGQRIRIGIFLFIVDKQLHPLDDHRHQSHGQCVCPKNKFWLCDADCLTCEFRRAGDHISLDYTTENEDGDTCSPLDALADTAPSIEDVLCDKAELDQLLARLDELMPEARKIGRLRLKGLTDEAIAEVIGIKRTTFRSRIEKAKKQLAPEYPDRF